MAVRKVGRETQIRISSYIGEVTSLFKMKLPNLTASYLKVSRMGSASEARFDEFGMAARIRERVG